MDWGENANTHPRKDNKQLYNNVSDKKGNCTLWMIQVE